MEKRTPLGRFIHTTWTNLNIRCSNGKYYHLRTKEKCKSYDDILICFTREEFKNFCYLNKNVILNLERPSLDRIDNNKNYSLDNVRIIELKYNIRKDKTVFKNGFGICSMCKQKKIESDFCKDKRRLNPEVF